MKCHWCGGEDIVYVSVDFEWNVYPKFDYYCTPTCAGMDSVSHSQLLTLADFTKVMGG